MKFNISSTKSAFLWNGVGKLSQFVITFFSGVLIARILSPNDYGLIGVLTIFMVISTLLVDSGFKDVLILNSKKNTDNEYTTVFYVNIFISVILYVLLFVIAPSIANYFDNQQLVSISRILFLSILINAFTIIPLTILTLNLEFKIISIVEISSTIITSSIGLFIAYNGYAVWALVFPILISSFLKMITFWIITRWSPVFQFDLSFFVSNIKFCSKLIFIRLITAISSNFIPVIIGRYFNLRDVGFFNRANNLYTIPNNIIVSSINEVSYPLLSKLDFEKRQVKFKELLKLSAMITFPVSMLLIVIAKPLILVLLTNKWYDSIHMLEILSLLIAISLLSFINNSMIKIEGKINLLFVVSLFKNLGTISLLFLFKNSGVIILCYVFVGVSYVTHIYYMYTTSRILNYSLLNQFRDLMPSFLSALTMGTVMYIFTFFIKDSNLLLLFSQIFFGTVILLILYWFFFKKEREMLLRMITNK